MNVLKMLAAASVAALLPLAATAQPAQAVPAASAATAAAKPAEPTPPPAPVAAAKTAEEDAIKITPYGFLLGNAYFSNKSFASRTYPGQVNLANDGGAFNMTAVQSRFGLNIGAKDTVFSGADLNAFIEFDFNGGQMMSTYTTTCDPPATPTAAPKCATTASAPSTSFYNGIMRLRRAGAAASWKTPAGTVAVLVGQDAGILAPLFAETVSWVASPLFWQAGNAWRRTPQARLTYTPVLGDTFGVTFQAAVLSPADASGPADLGAGNRSRIPDLEGRVAFSAKLDKATNATIGVGGHWNKKRYVDTATPEDMKSQGIAFDAEINAYGYVTLRSEYYAFKGLEDTYMGMFTPVQGTAGNRFSAHSNGVWAQATLKPFAALWLTAGFGRAFNRQDQLAAVLSAAQEDATRQDNRQVALGLIVNAGKYWRFGGEWITVDTKYVSGKENSAQQFAVSSQLKF